jgi:hypothetical protein
MVSEKSYDTAQRLDALVAAMPARVWRTTQQGNFASTTPVAITWQGFAGGDSSGIPVLSGATYCVKGMIVAAMGSPNQNCYTRFTGPSTSLVSIGFQCIEGSSVYNSGQCTAMAQDCTINMVASTTGEFKFEGIVAFTADGTLSMNGRISSTTPWAACEGSYLEASRIA